jgi:hypothetical protein
MFSGGVGSYEAARRVKQQVNDPSGITLLFADTRMEDEDLYRFRDETAAKLNLHLEVIADGRDPWDIFFDVRFLGNSRVDPCSRILKREIMRQWLNDHCDPADTVVHLGMDWTEDHRIEGARNRWDPWTVQFPLDRDPYEMKDVWLERCREEGIEPPRLYAHNFPHNNCGGFCIKAGQAQFARLLRTFPERYRYHERREQELRDYLGKDVAILKDRRGGKTRPLTLREFRERLEADSADYRQNEWGSCNCMGGDSGDTTLAEARSAQRITVKEAAARAGVHPSTWRRWEDGGRTRHVRQAARAVGKRVQDIDWPFPVQTDLEDFTS